jgi:hypothetical protein
MCAVTAAPGPAGIRFWEVMSRGRGPRVGCPPPEGVDVAYPRESGEAYAPAHAGAGADDPPAVSAETGARRAHRRP